MRRLNEKNDGDAIAQIFIGSTAPDFHRYKPGDSVAGAVTRIVSDPFAAIWTSTSSRDLIVHAKAGSASVTMTVAVNRRRKNRLAKFKQCRLMVGNTGVEIDAYALDV